MLDCPLPPGRARRSVRKPTSAVLRARSGATWIRARTGTGVASTHMTDDFDFDFDVDRGRSASRTENREPKETGLPRERHRPGGCPTRKRRGREPSRQRPGQRLPGHRLPSEWAQERQWQRLSPLRPAARRPTPTRATGSALGDDDFEPGSRSPLRERDDGPAGPPTPGEARNFAKEARRRASRRPSPILDFDEERARLEREATTEEEDGDFESMLSQQPQKSGVARRGSAIRHALAGRDPEPAAGRR